MSCKLHTTQEAPEIPRHLPVSVVAIMHDGSMLDIKLVDLVEKANKDDKYQDTLECLASNQQLNELDNEHPAMQLKKVWKKLSIRQVPNGRILLFEDTRVVPPTSMINNLLKDIHSQHSS